jgi:hypothetical protein
MTIISLNGIDRIGKTQQASLLERDPRVTLTGKLVQYSDRWPDLPPTYDFTWWFRDVPFEELVSIIIESIQARDAACTGSEIFVHDRGSRMFRAVCAATLVAREKGSVSEDDAIARVDKLFDVALGEQQDDVELYFVPDEGYRTKTAFLRSIIERTESAYLPWQNELYAEYQGALKRIAERYFSESGGKIIRIPVDASIVDIQNRVRHELSRAIGFKFEPLCEGLSLLVALGGLSESGKSGFAGRLNEKHQFYRLKIKYFDAIVQKRGFPSHSGTIGQEILDFLHDHRHINRASVESLHGDILPAYLKMLFGDRFKTVYLDTPEDVRIARTVAASKLDVEEVTRRVRDKDAVKVAGGGARVKDMADIVYSNDKPFDESFADFLKLLDISE